MGASPNPEPSLWLQILMPLGILISVGLVLVLCIVPGGGPSPLVIGGIVAALFSWIGISVLWPARADRNCPQCRQESLKRLDPSNAIGLVCTQCGWSDASASGWYLAEEELEALEPLALERRAARARQAQRDESITRDQ